MWLSPSSSLLVLLLPLHGGGCVRVGRSEFDSLFPVFWWRLKRYLLVDLFSVGGENGMETVTEIRYRWEYKQLIEQLQYLYARYCCQITPTRKLFMSSNSFNENSNIALWLRRKAGCALSLKIKKFLIS